MKPIATYLAEKLEGLVASEDWLLINNAADELRRLQAEVERCTDPPAQRQWVDLTPEERQKIRFQFNGVEQIQIGTEAKLKEKNT